jgi:serine kinase of HPr protein (carbohydrate metabolism regulator)
LLVADDRVVLSDEGSGVVARAPARLLGLIEVRGIGVVSMDVAEAAPVGLVVDLLPLESCPRFPDADERRAVVFGHEIARLALPIGAADGPLRVRLALQAWTAAD